MVMEYYKTNHSLSVFSAGWHAPFKVRHISSNEQCYWRWLQGRVQLLSPLHIRRTRCAMHCPRVWISVNMSNTLRTQ